MEPSTTPKCLVITLSLVLALRFVVANANDPNAVKTTSVEDPEIVNAAKFAIVEHNKKAKSTTPNGRIWDFVKVTRAHAFDVSPDGKKIAVVIAANDGPIGDFCQALVEVKHNVQTLVAFKEPVEGGEEGEE